MDEIILRDYLAIDRTYLANERTFLAYVRTALTCLLGGITLQKLFPTDLNLQYLGWFLLGMSVLTGGFGIWRSIRTHRRVRAYYTQERRLEAEAALKGRDES
ncbi:MAG: YidH family protein [Candidatus Sericytochromatia bacterium]